jgi:hypothetical protein
MSIGSYGRRGLIRKEEAWEEMSADSAGNEDNPRKEELAMMSIDCVHNRANEVIVEALEGMSID